MLTGVSVVGAISLVLLLDSQSTVARVLGLIGSAGWLLRARLHPVIRQRVPLLAAGLTGPAVALLGMAGGASGLVALGAAGAAIGVVYSRRTTSPYLRRLAEFAEVLLVLSVVPLACWVLGLYGWLRGLSG